MSFTYDTSIPTTGFTPSQQYVGIQTNFSSINSLVNVDHQTFGTSVDGTHKQLTFKQFASPSAPSGTDDSVAYPAAGVIDTSRAQFYFRNNSAIFPVSLIKAYCLFPANTTGPITPTNQYNINGDITVSGSSGSTRTYTINLVSNTVSGNNVGVIFSQATETYAATRSWTFSAGVLTLVVNSNSSPTTVIILQI